MSKKRKPVSTFTLVSLLPTSTRVVLSLIAIFCMYYQIWTKCADWVLLTCDICMMLLSCDIYSVLTLAFLSWCHHFQFARSYSGGVFAYLLFLNMFCTIVSGHLSKWSKPDLLSPHNKTCLLRINISCYYTVKCNLFCEDIARWHWSGIRTRISTTRPRPNACSNRYLKLMKYCLTVSCL